jgi:hypothetical protein
MAKHEHVHLVGSVNLDTVDEVWDQCLGITGNHLQRIPDGEPGPRRLWISYQYPMLMVSRFLIPSGEMPDEAPLMRLKVKPGVKPEEISFGELGYAREARLSYIDFCARRDAGKVPAGMRFQVCLPTPLAFINAFIIQEDIAKVIPGYTKAMIKEVKTIVDAIPHVDLAIQWDICIEMVLYDGRIWPVPWDKDMQDGNWKLLASIIPDDVEMGIHLCYGDFGDKHFIEPEDSAKMVGLANEISAAIDRDIAWIHMPVPIARHDDEFFQPMVDLKLHPETELFLGLVHLEDGVEGTNKRIASAEKVVADFGVATECGLGRSYNASDIEETLKIHAAVCTN